MPSVGSKGWNISEVLNVRCKNKLSKFVQTRTQIKLQKQREY